VWSTANQFLQGKVQSGMEMGMRVLTNTFFGLGGLLDPATEVGLTRRSEDFGQTLGVGLGRGPTWCCPFSGLRRCATRWACARPPVLASSLPRRGLGAVHA
jgi:phospholipid-binding lipoprotein MlaA